jgi:hypothetical protein
MRFFTEKPNRSNSMKHQLSVVNLHMEIRFDTKDGACRTDASRKLILGAQRCVKPVPKIGKREPLPTTT